ncbi:hypothetical protein OW763_02600 [Clostridium aestuarii]|uniref:DUF2238 domain-containing protein n=1 Tax=Clostridium aestuarii TaxID=338193 RepID=A0ABT4CYP3_9CLOT|nr:hypothetical protein [Clostridium aestuarii]MCY6483245.1 hypothetical protein [Clostridium aestuarii]
MKIIKKIYKKEIVLANTIRMLLILAIIISIKTHNWLNLFIAISTIILTYLPYIIARKNGIKLPASFQIVILSFIFAAQFLGELRNYYNKFWWWDIMLHTFSGIILGMVGFLLIYILNREEKIDLIMSPFFVALFSFTFALCIGALWEIFEFTVDSIVGLNMQKSGLVDTMWDLIVDSIGAFVTSVNGYFYQKRHQQVPVIKEFFDENPRFLKKKKQHDNNHSC